MADRNEITGKPTVLKELNMGLLKDALRKSGQATRVELSRQTKISQPTVNLLINELLADKTVISLGAAKSTGGRKAELYALNMKKAKAALVIVREDCFEASTVDMGLAEERREQIKRDKRLSFLQQLVSILQKMLQASPNIGAISVGVPGAVSEEGEVFAIPPIPEFERFALRADLQSRFGMPVRVTNDINATTFGYRLLHEEAKNLVYLYTEGKKLGAGLILNGMLYPGVGSFAGEVGYMQLGGRSVEEIMDGEENTWSLLELLAQVVVNLVCMFNPEKIVLAGREDMGRLLPKLAQECRRMLPAVVLPDMDIAEPQKEYYLKGLGGLGVALLNQDIHIT